VSSRIPVAGNPGDPDRSAVIRKQEAGQTCESREPGRLVIRHPPIPEDYQTSPTNKQTSPTNKRVVCLAERVVAALRAGQSVELDNVVLTGPLNLRLVAEPTLQGGIAFPRGRQQEQGALLQAWLDERRREHRAPDALAGQTKFRPIVPPIAIRNSRIDSIDASGVEPVLFLDAVDLSGSRIRGPVNVTGAIFKESVTLEAAQLDGRASFVGTHFDAGLDLPRGRLGAGTRFDRATFGAGALRRLGRRGFAETPALFTGATFAAPISFRDTVFESRADFQKTVFAGDVDFGAARFERRADFGHARFSAPLDASQAIFEAEARFPNAVFDKPASFWRAEFRWRADFGLASFNDAGTTFREARFGPSLSRRWQGVAGDQALEPRALAASGYDFRDTRFADRRRALARSEFEIHEVFAVAVLAVAVLGALICLMLQRRRLLLWQPALEGRPEVATVMFAAKGTPGLASPRQRLVDGAILMAAYAILAVGLATYYQTSAGIAVDLWVSIVYPVVATAVWVVAVYAASVALEFRARRLRADATRSDPPPPRLDYFDLTYQVRRSCDDFVARFVTRVSTGVLGLVGRRGVGRSSLARAVMERLSLAPPPQAGATSPAAESPGPILAVATPSPPPGDLLPFFTVLFRRVNDAARVDLRRRLFRLERGSQLEDTAGELIEPLPRAVFLPILVMLAAMGLFTARPWHPPIHSGDTADASAVAALRLAADWAPVLLLASVLLAAIVYYWRLKRRTDLRGALKVRPSGLLYMSTERVVERLAFEQSTSDEREGSLSLPYGVGLRRRQSRALKERQVTLPVMLEDFRCYVEELRSVYPGGVVVHIADADRIDDVASVRNLLIQIKATLVGGVLYLVPLPDTVLEGSMLSAPGLASALTGLLDDLAFVPPMSTVEGLRMLARRKFFPLNASGDLEARDGLGLAICVVSGGMPKEILRLLRRVSTEPDEWTVRYLVDRALGEARDSARDAVRRSGLAAEPQRRILESLETFLARPDDDAASASQLLESVPEAPAEPVEAARLRAGIVEVLGRLVQRRHAVEELQKVLASLGTWERELIADKRLLTEEPWTSPERLEQIQAAFLRDAPVVVGAPEKRVSA
jgi:hypothetical protein